MSRITRPLHLLLLPAAVLLLAACAGKQHANAARAEAEEVIAVHGQGPLAYRFDMTQHGKRMSADDFDAWMKAHGLSIAKGGPASKRDDGKAAAGKRQRD
ncbi:hypothetical protein [Pseudoxanthomonas suwonensis]|uniref:Lipoprotein n=1 Tax=Pseudoxanthomonas suwonensis TaxID=314722 RepID=A0A0E3Z0D0_9GAMM|nr:hypothetical protein [Pseudoxanthomonas suwonensis]AKC85972.1 hypothetical protein WQ53_03530 [Pseudoxanthomonas suwonensis]